MSPEVAALAAKMEVGAVRWASGGREVGCSKRSSAVTRRACDSFVQPPPPWWLIIGASQHLRCPHIRPLSKPSMQAAFGNGNALAQMSSEAVIAMAASVFPALAERIKVRSLLSAAGLVYITGAWLTCEISHSFTLHTTPKAHHTNTTPHTPKKTRRRPASAQTRLLTAPRSPTRRARRASGSRAVPCRRAQPPCAGHPPVHPGLCCPCTSTARWSCATQ